MYVYGGESLNSACFVVGAFETEPMMCLYVDVVVVINLIWMMIYNPFVASYVSHWCSHLLGRF